MSILQPAQLYALGAILAATLIYVSYMMYNQNGSESAKLAVRTNSECLKLKKTYGETNSEFVNCNLRLQKLIKQLMKTGEIRLKKCRVKATDKEQNTIGYCPVWAWYRNQDLTVSDPRLVQSIIKGRYIPEDKGTKTTNQPTRAQALTQQLEDSSSSSSSSSDDEQKKQKKAAKKGKKQAKKLLQKQKKDLKGSQMVK